MRIMLGVGSLPPTRCGIGAYTEQLAKALAETAGTNVAVVAGSGGTSDDGYELLRAEGGWAAGGARQLIRSMRAWRPDVVHFQYPAHGYGRHFLPWVLPSVAGLLGARVVITWHEYQRALHLVDLPNTLVPGGLVVVRPSFTEQMPRLFRTLIRHKKYRFIPNASAIPGVGLEEPERAAIRARWMGDAQRLIAYFGFVYPNKGVEELFRIADPATDALVLVGELNPGAEYDRRIDALRSEPPWRGRTAVTGYLPPLEVARVLAAADAVVLPFRDGGGDWNTTLAAAAAQGTFVVTTAVACNGLDEARNIYFARPGDIDEMRDALRRFAGRRAPADTEGPRRAWRTIVDEHLALYRELLR